MEIEIDVITIKKNGVELRLTIDEAKELHSKLSSLFPAPKIEFPLTRTGVEFFGTGGGGRTI